MQILLILLILSKDLLRAPPRLWGELLLQPDIFAEKTYLRNALRRRGQSTLSAQNNTHFFRQD